MRLVACAVRRGTVAAVWLFALALAAQAAVLWGVNGHPLTSYPGVTFAQQLDLVKGLGAKAYRVDVTSTGQMDALAALIAAAKPRGIEIVPILLPPIDFDKQSETELYGISKSFAEAFGRRFKNDIPVWELGNEYDIYALIHSCEMRDDGSHYPCRWGIAGGAGPLDYYGPRYRRVLAALRGLSDGIHAVAPQAKRAIGSSGWGHVGIFPRFKEDGLNWDISVWHMYGQDPEWAFKLIAPLGKPIWITEFNGGGGDQAAGATKWIRRIQQLAPAYRVEGAFFYELLDESYWGSGYEATSGLVRLLKNGHGGWMAGPPKPAYEAFKRAVATPPAGVELGRR
jgi:hypothetical protein